jgi:hypothetical protein
MHSVTSTRNPSFRTPARSLKHGRAVHDETTVYGHPKTVGIAGKKKQNVFFSTPAAKIHLREPSTTPQPREVLIDHGFSRIRFRQTSAVYK